MKTLDTNSRILKLLFLLTLLLFYVCTSYAQPALPPRTMTVTATQPIHFGTFSNSISGGTITVGYDGSRTSTGGITLLSIFPTSQPAIFEIKLCPGRNGIITFSPSIELSGSNGGTLTLEIGPTEKGINGSSFTTNNDCNFITQLRVGGTLQIPSNAIEGSYTGSFEITINNE